MDYQEELDLLRSETPLGPLDKNRLVNTIRFLLDLCEKTSGHYKKKEISTLLFQYLSHNYWFLITYPKFNRTVAGKTIEMTKDLKGQEEFEQVKIIANFLEQVERLKPYQSDQEQADQACQIIINAEQSEDMSLFFNLLLQKNYLPNALKMIDHPKLDLNYQNQEGNTSLMHAAKNGINLQFIQRLIENGANYHLRNHKGETAQDQAAYQNVKDYLQTLQ